MPSLQEAHASIETEYRRRTPRSSALFDRAAQSLPGGDTRNSTTFAPYPTYIARGEGARLTDVDGNELLDFLNNYTSLIHGNAFAPVVDAARKQMELGSAFGAPNEFQVGLAALMCERVPSVERIRFTNSGTEGTMMAIRGARAFTGRELIIKIEGGYHGTHDSVSAGAGVLRATREATLQVPFNDSAALEQLLDAHPGKVAAVIVEPVMGSVGMIAADHAYLSEVRRLTTAHDVLLILDEVMTFRLDSGGAQTIYGVQPDLTSFAKIIGGGFPVGAFGGRADIMDLFNPAHMKVMHAGTFNGNPVTMAAGLAAMEQLTPEKIQKANALGDTLRGGFAEVLDEQGIHGQATGLGSLVGIHLVPHAVHNYADASAMKPVLRDALHLALINRGVLTSRGGVLNTSTVMTESDVNHVIAAFQDALVELKPAIASECPELVHATST